MGVRWYKKKKKNEGRVDELERVQMCARDNRTGVISRVSHMAGHYEVMKAHL